MDDGGFDMPPIRFAASGSASIAWQTWGEGPETIIAVPPLAQNIELAWEWPDIRRMLTGFGSIARYVHFDKRGTGMSSRNVRLPEPDQRIDDMVAVMDAAGVDRAWVYGVSEGGPMALLLAASYPDRVQGLVLESTAAFLLARPRRRPDDESTVIDRPTADMRAVVEGWGTAASIVPDVFAPPLAGDPAFRRWHQRYERQSCTAQDLLTLMRMNGRLDARPVLREVTCPVLVIHRRDDPVTSVGLARDTAEDLADATLVVQPGAAHFPYAADVRATLDAMARFISGRPAPALPARPASVRVRVLGGFGVQVDGEDVPTSAWGSRRARQIVKRLVVEGGPVRRDALIDQLWPGNDDQDRLSARLSVQLSTVRRVLGGRIVADNETVALDQDEVRSDLGDLRRMEGPALLSGWGGGQLLPDDGAEPWVRPAAQHLVRRIVSAGHTVLADAAPGADAAIDAAEAVLRADPYDEVALLALVDHLEAAGHHGQSREAYTTYVRRMDELDLPAEPR